MEERGGGCAGRAGGRVRAAPRVPPPAHLAPLARPPPPSTTLSPLPFSPSTPQDEAVRLVIEECHEHNALMQEIIQCVKRDAGVGRAALVGVPRLERKRGPAWGGFRRGGRAAFAPPLSLSRRALTPSHPASLPFHSDLEAKAKRRRQRRARRAATAAAAAAAVAAATGDGGDDDGENAEPVPAQARPAEEEEEDEAAAGADAFAEEPESAAAVVVHHEAILRNKRLLLTYL